MPGVEPPKGMQFGLNFADFWNDENFGDRLFLILRCRRLNIISGTTALARRDDAARHNA